MDEPRVIIVVERPGAVSGVAPLAGELGFHVLPVRTVCEAVQAVERESGRVAAVFSGIALEDGNWCDLVERLERQGGAAPVILCTSQSSAQTWWDALEHGIWEVMTAPVTPHAFERIVKSCRDAVARNGPGPSPAVSQDAPRTMAPFPASPTPIRSRTPTSSKCSS